MRNRAKMLGICLASISLLFSFKSISTARASSQGINTGIQTNVQNNFNRHVSTKRRNDRNKNRYRYRFKQRRTKNVKGVPYIRYHYQTANNYRLRVLKNNEPIYKQPYQLGMNSHLYSSGNYDVHIDKIASAKYIHKYYRISIQRHPLGWVSWNEMKPTTVYQMPFTYVSQFWPSPAKDACEAASLKVALSAVGVGQHTSLRKMVGKIPRSDNPEKGYTNNPYKYGTGATIYPKALAKFARRRYRVKAKSVTGAHKAQLVYYMRHGDPVVFEGSYMMKNTGSDHSLVLVGYKPHYFEFVDPFSKTRGKKHIGWVSTRRFFKINRAKKRGKRAMVVFY